MHLRNDVSDLVVPCRVSATVYAVVQVVTVGTCGLLAVCMACVLLQTSNRKSESVGQHDRVHPGLCPKAGGGRDGSELGTCAVSLLRAQPYLTLPPLRGLVG